MATILVADDDPGTRGIVEKILIRDGHTVSVASDGRQTLRLLDATVFDLLITDLVMPDVEGLEVLRTLRKRPTRPRIVVMSGGVRGSAAPYLEIAAGLGADATLQKPFAPGDLMR